MKKDLIVVFPPSAVNHEIWVAEAVALNPGLNVKSYVSKLLSRFKMTPKVIGSYWQYFTVAKKHKTHLPSDTLRALPLSLLSS